MHPLDGARLKISRAESQIDQLASRQGIFRADTRYRIIRTEINPISGKYIYRVQLSGKPPALDWSCEIGEIAHNLRCALNYTIYQLALHCAKPETVAGDRWDRNLQFPIFKSVNEFIRRGDRMIKLLKPEHQTLIKGLQPYEGGGINHPLLWLEEINNADKHRVIQVVGVIASAGPAIISVSTEHLPFDFVSWPVILEDGAKVGEATADVDVDEYVMPLVAFWQGCQLVKSSGVIGVLNDIRRRVYEIIDIINLEFEHYN